MTLFAHCARFYGRRHSGRDVSSRRESGEAREATETSWPIIMAGRMTAKSVGFWFEQPSLIDKFRNLHLVGAAVSDLIRATFSSSTFKRFPILCPVN